MAASGQVADFTSGVLSDDAAEVEADVIRSLCVGITPAADESRTDGSHTDGSQAAGSQTARSRVTVSVADVPVANVSVADVSVTDVSVTDDEFKAKCALHIKGATIRGVLNLESCSIVRSIVFTNCVFTDAVNLTGASTKHQIRLTDCRLASVTADRLNSEDDVILNGRTEISGGASFIDARVGGHLRLSGSTLRTSDNCAVLDCTNLFVAGDLHLDHIKAHGNIRLNWAHVRSLVADHARIHSTKPVALDAESLHAQDDVLLNDDFQAHGEVRLLNSNVGDELRLTGAKLFAQGARALHAERIRATSIFLDGGFEAHGEVRLVGANVANQLNCTGGTFDKKNGGTYALDADMLTCAGDVFFNDGFSATGEVRLEGAEITRGLTCTNGEFHNDGGDALFADGMTTEGSVHLDKKFSAIGTVRLARATVGRQLNCDGGSFRNHGGRSLDVSGIACSGDILLRKAKTVGTVKLQGSRIARDLDCTDIELTGVGGDAFDAKEMRVGNVFTWRTNVVPSGRVDLSFAQARILRDQKKAWDFKGDLDILGFQYEILDSEMSFEDRKEWLAKPKVYSPQPYQQLTWAYQISGHDRHVEDTVAANHAARRKTLTGWKRWGARMWDWFIGWSVGYGFKFRRALVMLLAIGILNIVLFYVADYNDVIHPTSTVTSSQETGTESSEDNELDSNHCTTNYPCFIPPVYAFEILIPVLNLRQINYWLPTPKNPFGTFLFVWVILNIVFGWLASIAIVGGLNYAFGNDRASSTRPPPFSV